MKNSALTALSLVFVLICTHLTAQTLSEVQGLSLAPYEIPQDVTFYDGKFWVVTENVEGVACFYTSTDGENWSVLAQTQEHGVVDGLFPINGVLYATGYNADDGHFILSSTDGVNWTQQIVMDVNYADTVLDDPDFNVYYIREDYLAELLSGSVPFEWDGSGFQQSFSQSDFPDLDSRGFFYLEQELEDIPADDYSFVKGVDSQILYRGLVNKNYWGFDPDDLPAEISYYDPESISYDVETGSGLFGNTVVSGVTLHTDELEVITVPIDWEAIFNEAYFNTKTGRKEICRLRIGLREAHPDMFLGKSYFSFYSHELSYVDGQFVLEADIYPVGLEPSNGIDDDARLEYDPKQFIYDEASVSWVHNLDWSEDQEAFYERINAAPGTDYVWFEDVDTGYYYVENDDGGQSRVIDWGALNGGISYLETDNYDPSLEGADYEFGCHIRSEDGTFSRVWAWGLAETEIYDALTGEAYASLPPTEQILDYDYNYDDGLVFRDLYFVDGFSMSSDGQTWSDTLALPNGNMLKAAASGNGARVFITQTYLNEDEVRALRDAELDYYYDQSKDAWFYDYWADPFNAYMRSSMEDLSYLDQEADGDMYRFYNTATDETLIELPSLDALDPNEYQSGQFGPFLFVMEDSSVCEYETVFGGCPSEGKDSFLGWIGDIYFYAEDTGYLYIYSQHAWYWVFAGASEGSMYLWSWKDSSYLWTNIYFSPSYWNYSTASWGSF